MHISVAESTPVVVTVRGELDIATVEPVREALAGLARDGQLIVDLAGLSFCGCVGLRMLLEFQRDIAEPGQTVLANCSRELLRVMEISNVRALFDLVDTVDDARAFLRATVLC